MVGYSKNPEERLALIQRVVRAAVLKAASEAGLDIRSWEFREPEAVQKTGDGLLTAIPDSTVWPAVGTMIPKGVSTELSEFNREREHKVRVRVALHIGPYAEGELGWTTGTPIRLARLLDSGKLKEAADRCTYADVVVAHSNDVYQHIKASMPQADARNLSDEKKIAGKHGSEDLVYARFLAYYAGAPEPIPQRNPVFRVLGLRSSAAALLGLGIFAAFMLLWPEPAPHLEPYAAPGVYSGFQKSVSLKISRVLDQPNRRVLKLMVKNHYQDQTLCVSDTQVEFQEAALDNQVQLGNGGTVPVTVEAGQSVVQVSLAMHTDAGCSMDLLFEDATPASWLERL